MLTFKRGLGKNNANCVLKDSYKRYEKIVKNPLGERDYIEICKAFNEFLMLDVVCRSAQVTLGRLGVLSIKKYKCKPRMVEGKVSVNHMPVDYKATKEYWERNPEAHARKELIRLTNDHTNGYRYRFFWDKFTTRLPNKQFYSFTTVRRFSRMLSDVLKDDNIIIDFFLDETKLRPKKC